VSNSTINWSSATLITVMSTIAMIAPSTITPPIARILRSSVVGALPAATAAGV
jgi:hypothetical protein